MDYDRKWGCWVKKGRDDLKWGLWQIGMPSEVIE